MQKEVVQGCITSFVGGIWNWEGINVVLRTLIDSMLDLGSADVSGVKTQVVATFVPSVAVALSTGAVTAEGMTAPDIVEKEVYDVAEGQADKEKKEHATEE